jgi:diphthamide synthase (EF-2-diphthine--ammonia ligase)
MDYSWFVGALYSPLNANRIEQLANEAGIITIAQIVHLAKFKML